MDTGISLDTKRFLQRIVAGAKADIGAAYTGPFMILSEERAHTELEVRS